MVTFTLYQINDALDLIKSHIADRMRKRTSIDLEDESDNRQYTIAELRDAGWDDFDIVRLMWADLRTPWTVLKAFQEEKKRLDHDKAFSPLVAPLSGINSKYGRLIEFFEQRLDALKKEIAEAAANDK